MEDDRLLLTIEEAGYRLRMGKSALYVLLAKGALKSVKLGRSRRISVAHLNEFVESLPSAPPEPLVWATKSKRTI